MSYEKVIIIGSPRSGTNMLRDLLSSLPGVGTWPCDEINYIWRHGNVSFNSDQFTPAMATPAVKKYINRQFDQLAESRGLDMVVEKTCANSLRVGFVDEVLPSAKYIFIVRDGLDVVGSARMRWTAKLDISYVLKKVRYVPPIDLPFYALRYLYHRLYKLVSHEKRLALWGPVLPSVDQLLQRFSLIEVCALQWKACVDRSEEDLSAIPVDRLFRLSYEEFVANPIEEFAKISHFLDREVPSEVEEYLANNVRQNSVGKGRQALNKSEVNKLLPHISDLLKKYGYEG